MLLNMVGMCEADLAAFYAVHLDIPDGVIPVYSEKITVHDGKVMVQTDDYSNSYYESEPRRGFHFVEISRFARRTTFRNRHFKDAMKKAGIRSINMLILAYVKPLADFQSLYGLTGPRGGSFLCSYFKARHGTWGTVYALIRHFCQQQGGPCTSS